MTARYRWRRAAGGLAGGLLLLTAVTSAYAHQITGTRIATVARLVASVEGIGGTYEIQVGELAALDERRQMDVDGNGTITEAESEAWVTRRAAELAPGLRLTADGEPIPLTLDAGEVLPPEPAVVPGKMTLRFTVHGSLPFTDQPRRLEMRDENQLPRSVHATVAWQAGDLVELRDPGAAGEGAITGLEVQAPPGQAVAQAQLLPRAAAWRAAGGGDEPGAAAPGTDPGAGGWQQDLETALRSKELGARVLFVSIVLALFLGAAHALEPGHGKTLVAAYLVGERGTVGNAVFLGAIVTFTHTFSVILLGLVALFASRYVLPEQIFPWLSTGSGLLIVGMGVWLYSRHLTAAVRAEARAPGDGSARGHDDAHEHAHSHFHAHAPAGPRLAGPSGIGAAPASPVDYTRAVAPARSHDHTHAHAHPSDGDDTHDDDARHDLGHSHGGHHHSHVPEGRVTLGTLLALGITGGIVPCPGALVILLLAVGLGRIAFGLLLLLAFSLGLAAVLVGIGLLVVKARPLVDGLSEDRKWIHRLPAFSAAVITLVGLAMAVRGLEAAGWLTLHL